MKNYKGLRSRVETHRRYDLFLLYRKSFHTHSLSPGHPCHHTLLPFRPKVRLTPQNSAPNETCASHPEADPTGPDLEHWVRPAYPPLHCCTLLVTLSCKGARARRALLGTIQSAPCWKYCRALPSASFYQNPRHSF